VRYLFRKNRGRAFLRAGLFFYHRVSALAETVEAAAATIRNEVTDFFSPGLVGQAEQFG
jgi:hypothetical protein